MDHHRPRSLTVLVATLLTLGAGVMLLPLAWMLLTSLKTFPEILSNPMPWLPASPQWHNYRTVWEGFAYYRFFLIIIVGTVPLCFCQ
jgi:multiple sugar transport system permease protein